MHRLGDVHPGWCPPVPAARERTLSQLRQPMVVMPLSVPTVIPAGMRTAIGRMPVMQSNAVKAGADGFQGDTLPDGRHVLADA